MQNLVPHFVLEKHGKLQSGGETHGQFDAAALFVDVSGFGAVTHALSQYGSEAAEAMAGIMGRIFEPLVDAVYAYGGFITTFAGDGFTALFPAAEPQALPRALAAARAVQAHVTANPVYETAYGRFPFAVKLGLAQGPVRWGILCPAEADEGALAAYYFGGPAIDSAAGAEHLAQPGTLILAPEVSSALAELVQTLPSGDEGHARVLGLAPGHDLPAPAALLPVEARPGQERFVPPEFLAHTGHGEFRLVVTLFLNLMGVQAHADLAPFVQAVFRLQREQGGTLARVDFGDKGCTLLLFWGVSAGSESDIDRALDFALALGEHTPGSYKAGLTYATMYAGPAGSARRGEWTCYGDGINLAARLMTAAPWGGLWLDEGLARRAGGQFITEEVGRRTFKGFDMPIAVYALVERQRPEVAVVFQGRMVGHATDLGRLEAFVGPLLAPPGERRSPGILYVEGEAGLGKSRLVTEFLMHVTAPTESGEPRAQWALCQTDAAVRAPFNPWRYWLRSYFQQSPAASAARNKRAFARVLDGLVAATEDTELQTELNRGRPFLGALLDLYWDASPYDEVPPEGRYELTLAALTALVRAESRRCPLVLNLEDAHWLDEDSLAVVIRLMRIAADEPWAILATARPMVGDRPLFGDLPYERLALGPLSSAELAELTREVLGGPVDADLSVLLDARAEGNPFFAEQILLFLREQGGLVADGDAWRLAEGAAAGAAGLPADVRLIFTSRLDGLPREVRDVVQTAAVLGREFEVRVLAEVLGHEECLTHWLREAERSAIWMPLTEIHYLFKHALLRDAAYEMQLQARRRELHRLAAEALEKVYAAAVSAHVTEIAYHYHAAYQQGLTEVRELAVDYLERAGQRAAAGFENAAAVHAFGDALDLLAPEEVERSWDLLLQREAVYDLSGNREAQQADLEMLDALAGLGQRPTDRAVVALRRARYGEATTDYSLAVEQAEAAVRLAQAAGRVDLEAEAQLAWSISLYEQGDYPAVAEHGQQALALVRAAERGGDRQPRETEANTLRRLGNVAYFQQEVETARAYWEQALTLYQAGGHGPGESKCLNNLGSLFLDRGDLASARCRFEQALAICRATGDRRGEGQVLDNLGFVVHRQDDVAAARDYYRQSLVVARAAGDRRLEASVLYSLGTIHHDLGDLTAERECYEQSLIVARASGDRRVEAAVLRSMGAKHRYQGNLAAACEALEQSLSVARATGNPQEEGWTLMQLADLYCSQGQVDRARELAGQALALAEQTRDLYLVYNSSYISGQVALLEGDAEGACRQFATALAVELPASNADLQVAALAGLAQANLRQGDLLAARESLSQAMPTLADDPALSGAAHPFRALLQIAQSWLALGDPIGMEVIDRAYRLLQERAALLPDEAARRAFLDNVPENRELIALYETLQHEESGTPPEEAESRVLATPVVQVPPTQEAPSSASEPQPAVLPETSSAERPEPPPGQSAAEQVSPPQPAAVSSSAPPEDQSAPPVGVLADKQTLATQIAALLGQVAQAQGMTLIILGDIHIQQIVVQGSLSTGHDQEAGETDQGK